MVNLEQLSLFIDIVDKGSFTAAARARKKSVSTVSYLITQLEEYLNVKLLDRSTKLPTLTVDGKKVYDAAQMLILQSQKIDSVASDLVNGIEQVLLIGIEELIPWALVEEQLAKVANRFPNTKLQITRGLEHDLSDELINGDLDIVFIASSGQEGTQEEVCFDLVGVHPKFMSNRQNDSNLSLEYLEADKFVLCHSLIRLLEDSKKGVELIDASLRTCSTLEDTMNLVVAGIGWSIVPRELTLEFHQTQRVDIFEINTHALSSRVPIQVLRYQNSQENIVKDYLVSLF